MGVCIREMLATAGDGNPVVLVHGAANSASVWTFWQEELAERGWSSYAVDLRGHGGSAGADLSRTGMSDYAADVVACARQLERPPSPCRLEHGWPCRDDGGGGRGRTRLRGLGAECSDTIDQNVGDAAHGGVRA